MSENESITYQHMWHTTKVVLRGPFIALYACITKKEMSQINDLFLTQKIELKNMRNSKVEEE